MTVKADRSCKDWHHPPGLYLSTIYSSRSQQLKLGKEVKNTNNTGEAIMHMSSRTRSMAVLCIKPVAQPSVFTLLKHIASSVMTGGMIMLLVFGGVIITFLHYNDYPSENFLMVLFSTIVVTAFIRGCQAWQKDLNAYHNYKSDLRHSRKFVN